MPADQAGAVWPQVAPLAAKALRRIREDNLTPEIMLQRVLEGRYLMWAVTCSGGALTGVLLLEVVKRRRGRVLMVVLVAGARFTGWAPAVQPLLQDFAAIVGARKIESHSRPGMEAWMRELGWRKRAVIMEWEPEHG